MTRPPWITLALLCSMLGLALLYLPTTQAIGGGGTTERVSVSSQGQQANGDSAYPWPVLSPDGRFAFFASFAANLIPTDTNYTTDAFVHDRLTGETHIVGGGTPSAPYWGITTPDDISADGRVFLYTQYGEGVVPTDTNQSSDIFVWDAGTDTTELVSRDENGNARGYTGRAKMSADSNLIVYLYGPLFPPYSQPYLYNRTTRTTSLASLNSEGEPANAGGLNVDIAEDGSFIVFESLATNLVATDTNTYLDLYYRNLTTGEVRLLTPGVNGGTSDGDSTTPRSSADGRYVAFYSAARNLVPNDVNGSPDIFVYDLHTGTLEMVSVASDGTPGNDVALPELSISGDGRYVAFASRASNLVSGDQNFRPDIFVHDRQTHETRRVSVDSNGTEANDESVGAAISADGQAVLFSSAASNLVTPDNNDARDMFVHQREPAPPLPHQLALPLLYRTNPDAP